MRREPAVAGKFYPDDKDALTQEIERHIEKLDEKIRVIGVVSPHAGFMYSGDVAGSVYSKIEIPETVIILGPNHTGAGGMVSLMTEGQWSMPMGEVEIDTELANAILENSTLADENSDAHKYEHSLETQIPFLQYFRKDFKIVPICFMRMNLRMCNEVSQAIVKSVKALNRTVLIVASSDMTHFESHDSASRKDKRAIDQIVSMNPQGLHDTVMEDNITMCGVNPVTVMLMASKEMGASKAELVKYMTSGEVSGDYDRVVGYAGLIVK